MLGFTNCTQNICFLQLSAIVVA